ncbi:membrane protein of unknown function [Cupriavidus neocaledonicus]|uniref:EamA domain-containing protein n=1 Tax=Cupriavidus neocaledonicus TaxID=1040979 RepID=A0A375H728_9BURK|nr:membrane protein of unknown function [Cupriavidus neocaledonicus]
MDGDGAHPDNADACAPLPRARASAYGAPCHPMGSRAHADDARRADASGCAPVAHGYARACAVRAGATTRPMPSEPRQARTPNLALQARSQMRSRPQTTERPRNTPRFALFPTGATPPQTRRDSRRIRRIRRSARPPRYLPLGIWTKPDPGNEHGGIPRAEVPWLIGAIVAGGVAGPALLMTGLVSTNAASASLLLNVEGVFTAVIAWVVFKENADRQIVLGMIAIVAGGLLLSWQPGSLQMSTGALLIVGACLCWAVDNNLTRKVSSNDALLIACLKGLVAGLCNTTLALMHGAVFRTASTSAKPMPLPRYSRPASRSGATEPVSALASGVLAPKSRAASNAGDAVRMDMADQGMGRKWTRKLRFPARLALPVGRRPGASAPCRK